MNNLEKMIKFAREKKAADFTKAFSQDVAGRIQDKFNDMKTTIAKTMFSKKD